MTRKGSRPATSSGEPPTWRSDEDAPAITATAAGLRLGIRVTPAAPRTMLLGAYGDRLKVAVHAPPEDNRANQELELALAQWFRLRREQVRVVAGLSGRDKTVELQGVDEAELRLALARLLAIGRS
jgi:uncharacterized protein (TIGR00251 family)